MRIPLWWSLGSCRSAFDLPRIPRAITTSPSEGSADDPKRCGQSQPATPAGELPLPTDGVSNLIKVAVGAMITGNRLPQIVPSLRLFAAVILLRLISVAAKIVIGE